MGVRVALVPEEHADVARLHDSGPSSPQGVTLMQSITRRSEAATSLKRFYPSVVGTADTVDSKPTAFGRESATLSRRTKLGASSPDTFRSDDLIVLDSAFESRVEPHRFLFPGRLMAKARFL